MYRVKQEQATKANLVVEVSGRVIEYISQEAKALFNCSDKQGEILSTLLPETDLSILPEGKAVRQTGIRSGQGTFSIYIKKHSFSLRSEDFYLLSIMEVEEESEQTLKELLDIKFALDESAIIAMTDKRGKITYVNQKFVDISQYSMDELLGKDHGMINSGYHSKEFMRNLWQTISSGNVWRGEIKNRAKNGDVYWVDTTIVPFLSKDGQPYQYLAIRYEVTEHKKVVEQLKQSIQELMDVKFALDESSIVAMTDKRGKITYVNDMFCEISKYSRDELIGRDHRIINSGYHSREFFGNLWKTIAAGKVWKGEIRNKAKDGTYYWMYTTIIPFLNEEGEPFQYMAIRSEITEKKRVEHELQQMMRRILDVQEEERKRLSRNLHDGIGQNLYSHLITINVLRSQLNHPLLDQMQKEASDLIEEVRDISWELRPSVLDDLGLVPAIRSFLSRYIDNYGIDIDFNCSLPLQRLSIAIETTIYRVIQEALTNVRKYAKVKHATVDIVTVDEKIKVSIRDDGQGFDKKHLQRGVGLFSMEERARSVGGGLDIQSEIGRGTTVILELPTLSDR
ncbi:PAS domain-containing sensor histidine kinase [Fictibacillus enclensis]|uniref:PAS domain-containing sensor histidine kinase n=1 Tax=Fictibacillus enclensis TaxID=1017270 RepID=UPI0024C0251A|nr:PAS domain-containing protein [Fictibacillus enclensis]WHY71185.1 PAS domain S-box protein [Fictibacillus enclensis]